MSDSLLAGIIATIEPAHAGLSEEVHSLLASGGDPGSDGMVELAARLAAASHTLDVALAHRHVLICAADHGIDTSTGDPSERARATLAAVREIASGTAAVCAIARSARASVLIVDCGMALDGDRPAGVLELAVAPGTADICRGPAMTRAVAEAAVNTGIALCYSLADSGCDCLALGQLAPGSHGVATALIAHLAAIPSADLSPAERAVADRARRANPLADADALSALAALGGLEIGVMCGVVLAAASLRIPVILDDRGTSAAALLAARLAPASAGYLIASHAGTGVAHRRALEVLGLSAIFDMAISHGEGAGAATAMPILATAAELLRQNRGR